MDPTRTPNTPGESGRMGDTSPMGTPAGQYNRPGVSGSTGTQPSSPVGGSAGTPPRNPAAGSTGVQSGKGGPAAQDQNAIDKAKEAAAGVVGQAKDATAGVVGQAQEAVQPQIESQKDKAVGQLGGLAEAVRQTGRQLHERNQHGLAGVIEQSARRVDRLASYLDQRDLGQLVDDVEQYSRREPAMFIGGALALGFIASRFLKSSRERAYQNQYQSRGSDYSAYRSSAYSNQPGYNSSASRPVGAWDAGAPRPVIE